jgi:hypothetical protein
MAAMTPTHTTGCGARILRAIVAVPLLSVVLASCSSSTEVDPGHSQAVAEPTTTASSTTTPTTLATTTTQVPTPQPPEPVPVSVTEIPGGTRSVFEVAGGTIELESDLGPRAHPHLALVFAFGVGEELWGLTGYRFISSADPDELANRYRDITGANDEVSRRVMWSSGGVAFNGEWVFINRSQLTNVTRVELFRIAIHELIHIRQQQLSAPAVRPGDWWTNARQPNWLLEGGAEYVSGVVVDTYHPGFLARFDAELDAAMAHFDGDLARLEGEAFYGPDQASNFLVSSAAARHLVELAGIDAVNGDYWAARSGGGDWKVTFEQVFGLSVDAFYESFRERAQT